MRVFIGVLCGTERHNWIVPGLCTWLLRRTNVEGIDVQREFICDVTPVWVARNELVDYALKTKPDWIVMIDNDQIPPPELLATLKTADERGIDIVGIRSFMFRECDAHPIPNLHGQRPVNPMRDELFEEIAEIATGVFAVRRKVFEKLTRPFFTVAPVPERTGYEVGRVLSEDWNFCRIAREAGFRVFASRNLEAKHLKTVDLLRYHRQIARRPEI